MAVQENGHDAHSPEPMLDERAERSSSSPAASPKKRSASTSEPAGPPKVTKRRAARACVSCRARKVRCDVVEGAPCGNCRWDNVECIVQESRRRKKNIHLSDPGQAAGGNKASAGNAEAPASSVNPCDNSNNNNTSSSVPSADQLRRQSQASVASLNASGIDAVRPSNATPSFDNGLDGHVPHLIYQQTALRADPVLLAKLQAKLQAGNDGSRYPSIWPGPQQNSGSVAAFSEVKTAQFLNSLEEPDATSQLPAFIRPLPGKIATEDVSYLFAKGALTLPSVPLQNALLRAYVEYVHPYMPLLELHDFLRVVNSRDGLYGQVSLFLYHAVMFAGTAYVDSRYLKQAGYTTRKAARRAFFQKARLLYDFDYESDRLVLVQSLLLMSYWFETPDDQKDTWHWMGIAISLAHTIGLHRNPANTHMTLPKQKLWKRIWWSCFMRDRLVALGMRRPTRIKDEDFDVPMLEESDLELDPLADDIQVIGPECTLMRDHGMQRELGLMCIAKARLCLCISHMLKAQYSVLIRDKSRAENTTNSTMMLFPNKQLDNVENVSACDTELLTWVETLPSCCQYHPLTSASIQNGRAPIAVHRNLLHMVYMTTLSALHRPQFLPSSPSQAPAASQQAQETSRMRVRDAAMQITHMASEMHHLRLERYLPTTGVTVILPAMIIHLLEIKSPLPHVREKATRGFRQCMKVMEKLRDIYAAADYAVGFLDAALRKASIDIHTSRLDTGAKRPPVPPFHSPTTLDELATPPPEPGLSFLNLSTAEATKLQDTPTFVPPSDLVSSNSPPHSDESATGLTPSASGSSDGALPLDLEIDFNEDQDEFDWNALTGTNFDFDQWLHFPGDGAKNNNAAATNNGNASANTNTDDDAFLNMLTDSGAGMEQSALTKVF